MAIRRAIFGWPKVASSFALSGGSWLAGYPLTNLQSLPISKIARSTNALTTSTIIIATSATQKKVGLVALARHNLSTLAQIQIRLYSDVAMTSLLYDSGLVDVWPALQTFDTLEWEDDAWWTGTYSDAELAGTTWTWIWLTPTTDYLASAVRLDIADTGNTAGYVQAGYLELAAAYQVAYNPSWGAQYGHRIRSQVTEAIGGAKYVDPRDTPRVFKGSIRGPRTEALGVHFEMRRQLDADGVVIWVPEPDVPAQWPRTAMLAQLVDPGLMAYATYNLDDVPIALEEVIG